MKKLLFVEYGKINPASNAICSESTAITHESLNNVTNVLASKLIELGIEAGNMIAVCVNKPIDFIIASLSIFKLECNVIPLDPLESQIKNQSLLDSFNPSLLITNSTHLFSFKNKVLNIDDVSNLSPSINKSYTHNSFGVVFNRPYIDCDSVGMLLRNSIFENWIAFNKETLNISFKSSIFIYRNFKDLFSYIWLPVLSEGGTLYIDSIENENLSNIQNCSDIESIIMPLSLIKHDSFKFTQYSNLKYIITFGEDLFDTTKIKNNLNTIGVKWYNYFGFPYIQMVSTITNTPNGNVTYFHHEGKPIKNITGYILDETLLPQPVGIPGELYMSFQEKYTLINNDELQNDVIIRDKYNCDNYLFKAGYKAKLLSNGRFQIIEHSDKSIFVNGSLGTLHEIDYAIKSIPTIIKDSAITYNLDKILVYYSTYENISIYDVLSHLKQNLSYIYFPLNLIPSNQIPKDLSGEPNIKLLQEARTLSSAESSNLEIEILKLPLVDCAVIPVQILSDSLKLKPIVDIYCVLDNTDEILKNKLMQVVNNFIAQTGLLDNNIEINYYYVSNIPRKSNNKADINLEALSKIDKLPLFTIAQNQPSKLENELLELWREILEKPDLTITDNFYRSGGSSILLSKLIFKIRDKLGLDIPFRAILSAPTVQKLALYINGGVKQEVLELKKPDFTDDVMLDSSIKALASFAKSPSNEHNNILLTGSTGFVGAYLLDSLLKLTKSNIYCLVRSKTESDAKEKILNNLSQYGLRDSIDQSRIFPITGDLTLSKLGLDPQQYKNLSEKIDVIYHNGALVNFSYPYDALKAANVDGTKEIIRFAAAKKIKHIHHISTLAVYSALTNGEIIDEDFPLSINSNLKTGYSQSKLVADCIVQSARSLGLPCTIYRLCTAVGDSNTGACQTKDLFWILLNICIKLKVFPNINLPFNFMPVDSLSESIVRLSLEEKVDDQSNYHLDNVETISIIEIATWLKEFGYPVEIVSYDLWYSTMLSSINESMDASIGLLLGSFPQSGSAFDKVKHAKFVSQKTNSQLKKLGMDTAPLSKKEFFNNINYFIKIGFLPKI